MKGTNMSILESLRDSYPHDDLAPQASWSTNDPMLRTIGALILLGIGAMHFLQIVATFQGTPLLGWAYLLLIASCVVVAGSLVTRGDRRAWAAAGIVSLGAIGGYLFTRLMSTPLDNQDVGNWSCMLGLAALFVETSLLVISLYALAAPRKPQTEPFQASLTVATRRGRTAA
jgi:hypothetical protein